MQTLDAGQGTAAIGPYLKRLSTERAVHIEHLAEAAGSRAEGP